LNASAKSPVDGPRTPSPTPTPSSTIESTVVLTADSIDELVRQVDEVLGVVGQQEGIAGDGCRGIRDDVGQRLAPEHELHILGRVLEEPDVQIRIELPDELPDLDRDARLRGPEGRELDRLLDLCSVDDAERPERSEGPAREERSEFDVRHSKLEKIDRDSVGGSRLDGHSVSP